MQFTADSHPAIAAGQVTVTIRLWQRLHAKVGGRYKVGTVDIEVDHIEMIPFAAITKTDIRRSGTKDREALRALAAHAGPIHDDTLVYRIEFHVVGEHQVRTVEVTEAEVDRVSTRLDAMDARSSRGPWTRQVLQLIAKHPGRVSTELAVAIGRPRPDFKIDVRKLKALGLTESLEVGYRLTPLGVALAANDGKARRR
jgi:hypothetical protein